jgi:hypothetical protein
LQKIPFKQIIFAKSVILQKLLDRNLSFLGENIMLCKIFKPENDFSQKQ